MKPRGKMNTPDCRLVLVKGEWPCQVRTEAVLQLEGSACLRTGNLGPYSNYLPTFISPVNPDFQLLKKKKKYDALAPLGPCSSVNPRLGLSASLSKPALLKSYRRPTQVVYEGCLAPAVISVCEPRNKSLEVWPAMRERIKQCQGSSHGPLKDAGSAAGSMGYSGSGPWGWNPRPL